MLPSLPQSQSKPDAPTTFGPDHTPYNALSGEAAVRALVECFYSTMDRSPQFAAIRALHQSDLAQARQKLYEFLSGWLGGPQLYVEKHGHPRLRARHMPFAIGEIERDQWLACMTMAMDECGIAGDVRAFLDSRFRHVADFLRNQNR